MTLAERLSQLNWGGPGFSQYDGQMKGDHSSAEQAAADQRRTMEDQLMQQQLGLFKQQMGQVNSVLNPMIAQGGLPPAVEAAMRSQALNEMGQQFKGGVGEMNQALVARGMTGGPMAGAGGVAQGFGALNALQAGLQTNALNQIQMDKYGALMNELGMKMGIGSQFGGMAGGFNQGGGQALGQGVQAAYNADQAATSFWGPMLGALGSVGAGVATGGMSNLGKGVGFFG